jgi:hypothetical protein
MLAYRNAKEIGLNAEYNKIKQPTLEALMRQNLPVTGRNLELPKDTNILSTTSLKAISRTLILTSLKSVVSLRKNY